MFYTKARRFVTVYHEDHHRVAHPYHPRKTEAPVEGQLPETPGPQHREDPAPPQIAVALRGLVVAAAAAQIGARDQKPPMVAH